MQQFLNTMYNALGAVLAFFYSLVPDLGVSIILLTIAVMVILYPLTAKQFKSMMAMQRVQPEIKKLQAKYKGDRQKLNEEMMRFYQENHINPLSGCLPLLVQMPIFFLLFRVLRDPYKHIPKTGSFNGLYNKFCGGLKNCGHPASNLHSVKFLGIDLQKTATEVHGITTAAPYFVLVGLVVVTGLLQTRQQLARLTLAPPQTGQDQQRQRRLDELSRQEEDLAKQLRERHERLNRLRPGDRFSLSDAHDEELQQAQAEFERAVDADPSFYPAWYNLGLTYKDLGDAEKGVDAFTRVTQIANEADPWYFVGYLDSQLQRYDQAIAAFQKALALFPLHASAEFGLARAYQRSGNAAAARFALRLGSVRLLILGRSIALGGAVAMTLWHVLARPSAWAMFLPIALAEIAERLVLAVPTVKSHVRACFLYISDAADDTLCVDLGGRRIIK